MLSSLLTYQNRLGFIGPEFLPHAALRLSPFYYYGTPLTHGLSFASVLGLMAVAALALGLSAFRFVRKDIGV